MNKPTDYFVEYAHQGLYQSELKRVGGVEDSVDPSRFMTYCNATSLRDARRIANTRQIKKAAGGTTRFIYHRSNIEEIPPSGQFGTTTYEYDVEFVEDVD